MMMSVLIWNDTVVATVAVAVVALAAWVETIDSFVVMSTGER
jgi:hypothetical protein